MATINTQGLLVVVMVMLASCASKPKATNSIEELQQKVDHLFSTSDLPGFSLVVVDDEQTLFQGAWGYADVAQERPFTEQSVQNIASISKTFISVALMQAVEQGLLDLDQDINTYLPFTVKHPQYPNEVITLRQLSQHTSGIIDGDIYAQSYVLQPESLGTLYTYVADVREYLGDIERHQVMDESEFLQQTLSTQGQWYSADHFSDQKPGVEFNYSNIGATLAAYVIEQAVNMPYEAYTAQNIFKPLGMTHTNWREYGEHIPSHNQRYLPKAQPIPDYHLITKADGALVTNASDMALYLIEMLKGYHGQGSLVSAESYRTIFTENTFQNEKIGLFWSFSDQGHPNHTGADPGVMTLTSFDPERKLGYFFMTNVSAYEDKEMLKSIKHIIKAVKMHQW